MSKIGIFFGTDTGNTRRIAKDIHSLLGVDIAAKPVNIRTAKVEDLLHYECLILGTPTYGEGELPGLATGSTTASWAEFLPKLTAHQFTGKTVALYGLGNQKSYAKDFVSGLFYLYNGFKNCGANVIGATSTEGYLFKASKAVVEGEFVGLVLDQENQKELTETRLTAWLEILKPSFDSSR